MFAFISVALGLVTLVLGIYFWESDNRDLFMLKLKKFLNLRK